jgi:predicted acetyltransferase
MPVARSVRPSEIDRAVDIALIAFEVTGEAGDHWRARWHEHVERWGADTMLVVEHEGQLVSSMVLIPQPMWMGNVTVPSAAVAGVGTVPEARRVGAAAAMMEETVRRLRSWGSVTSPMWPFSYVYYRKFGWEIGAEVRAVTWPREIAFQIEPEGNVSDLSHEDWRLAAEVWDILAKEHRCATARVEHDWLNILRDDGFGSGRPGRGALLCRQDGRPAGYALYSVPEATAEGERKPVEVNELRTLNSGAAVALIEALKERLPDAAKFSASLSVADRTRSIVVDPRSVEAGIHPSFGFRVALPDAALALLHTPEDAGEFTLAVDDCIAGRSTWRVRLAGGPAEVSPASGDADLACSIQTLSQITSGLLKPIGAAATGLLEGSPAAVRMFDSGTIGWKLPYRSWLEAG